MFKNRSFNLFVVLTIAVLAVFSISAFFGSATNTVPTGARNAAEQDKRMVMQELERERLDQLNANSSVVLSPSAIAEQDMRMVMKELERERLDQLNANPPSPTPAASEDLLSTDR